MSERLELTIDANGMVTGSRVGVRSLDDIKAAAGRAGQGLSSASRLVGGLGAAFTALAGARVLRDIVRNTIDAERAEAQLAAAIKSTGGAAGKSIQELKARATALERMSGFEDEAVQGAQALLLTFTSIRGARFDEALEAVLNVSARMGTDLSSSALQIGKALNAPLDGLSALTRMGIQFSDSQKSAIKEMVKLGDIAGAQKIILAELETQFGGSAAAARDTLGGALKALSNSWGNLLEMVGGSGGFIRTGVEGIVTGLNYLVDNWHALEAGIHQTLANTTRSIGRWTDFVLGKVEQAARGLAGARDMLGFDFLPSEQAINARMKAFVDGIAGARRGVKEIAGDIAGGFDQKAADAIAQFAAGMGKVKSGAASAVPAVATLSESAKKLAAHLKEVNFEMQFDDAGLREQNAKLIAAMGDDARKARTASILADMELVSDRLKEQQAYQLANISAEEKRKLAISEALRMYKAGVISLEKEREILRANADKWSTIAEDAERIATAEERSARARELFAQATQLAASFARNRTAPDGLPASAQDTRGQGRSTAISAVGQIYQNPYNIMAWWQLFNGIAQALTSRGGIHGLTDVTASGGRAGAAITNVRGTRDMLEHLEGLGEVITSAVNGILESIDAELVAFNVRITQKGQGWRVSINNGFSYWFDDLEEAVNYAILEGVRGATLSGAAPEVLAAMRNSTATTFEELFSDLEFGKWVADLNLAPVAAELDKKAEELAAAIERAIRLGIDPAKILAGFALSFQQQRDQLLGIQRNPADQLRADVAAYNQQLLLTRAEAEAKKAALLVRKAELEAEIALIRAEHQIGEGRLRGRGSLLEAEAALVNAEVGLVVPMLAALAAVNAAIAGAQAILDTLPDLISNEELEAALRRLRGGGRRGDDREQLAQILRDSERSALSPYAQALAELNDKIAEATKLAHGDAAALAQINQMRERELALLRAQAERDYAPYLGRKGLGADMDQFLADLDAIPRSIMPNWEKAIIRQAYLAEKLLETTDRLVAFGGDFFPTANIDRTRAEAAGLIADFTAIFERGGMSAQEYADKIALVNAALDFRLDQIGMGLLDQLYAPLKDAAEFSAQILQHEKDKVALNYEIIKAQLMALNLWEANAELWGRSRDAALGGLGGAAAGGPTASGELYNRRMDRGDEAAKTMLDAAKRMRDAIDDLIEFQRSLRLDKSLSPLTPKQRLDEARAQLDFGAGQAMNLTGDAKIEAIRRVKDLARTYLAEARDYYRSNEAYEFIFGHVNSLIDRIIGARPQFAAGGIAYHPSTFGERGPEAAVPLPDGRSIPVTVTAAGGKGGGLGSDPKVLETLRQAALASDERSERLEQKVEELIEQVEELTGVMQQREKHDTLRRGRAA